MAVVAADRPLRESDVVRGAYIRKDRRLMWVAGVLDGQVVLEDCSHPALPCDLVRLPDLLRGSWRLVRAA